MLENEKSAWEKFIIKKIKFVLKLYGCLFLCQANVFLELNTKLDPKKKFSTKK